MQNENEAGEIRGILARLKLMVDQGDMGRRPDPSSAIRRSIRLIDRLTSDAAKAREAAIEECAKVAEGYARNVIGDECEAVSCDEIATAIRALKASTSDSVEPAPPAPISNEGDQR